MDLVQPTEQADPPPRLCDWGCGREGEIAILYIGASDGGLSFERWVHVWCGECQMEKVA